MHLSLILARGCAYTQKNARALRKVILHLRAFHNGIEEAMFQQKLTSSGSLPAAFGGSSAR